jgi:hypothetical protein
MLRRHAANLLEKGSTAWKALSPRQRQLSGAVTGLALVTLLLATPGWNRCSNRSDVEARVAEITSDLQQAASRGDLSLEELAKRIEAINAAATQFDKDASAHCEALAEFR